MHSDACGQLLRRQGCQREIWHKGVSCDLAAELAVNAVLQRCHHHICASRAHVPAHAPGVGQCFSAASMHRDRWAPHCNRTLLQFAHSGKIVPGHQVQRRCLEGLQSGTGQTGRQTSGAGCTAAPCASMRGWSHPWQTQNRSLDPRKPHNHPVQEVTWGSLPGAHKVHICYRPLSKDTAHEDAHRPIVSLVATGCRRQHAGCLRRSHLAHEAGHREGVGLRV